MKHLVKHVRLISVFGPVTSGNSFLLVINTIEALSWEWIIQADYKVASFNLLNRLLVHIICTMQNIL